MDDAGSLTMMIVFLGPDGSGKSSVIQELSRSLSGDFESVKVFHLKPPLKPQKQGLPKPPVTDPHGGKPYSPLVSCIKLIYFLLVYNLGYWLNSGNRLPGNHLVILDRYYYDLFIDPLRFRYGGRQSWARIIGRWIPKPAMTFLLDAPPEILQARKQEVSFEETRRQREEYLALIPQLPGGRILDATSPVSELVAQIRPAILAKGPGLRSGEAVSDGIV